MAKGTTKIYTISGLGKSKRIGAAVYPQPLTADSVPDFDEWGPDNWWSPQAYIQWHKLNRAQYGLDIANGKFEQAMNQWSMLWGAELEFIYNTQFRDYFRGLGFDITSGFLSPILVPADEITDSLGDVATGVSNTVSGIGKVLPWAVGAGLLIWGYKTWFTDGRK
ncbi:hypothetical protein [Methylotenera sp.]|uniref:hypothetical protein n=1 Tax=Methylotenera sp. TaxID=2051956 RepID=UPI002ED9C178